MTNTKRLPAFEKFIQDVRAAWAELPDTEKRMKRVKVLLEGLVKNPTMKKGMIRINNPSKSCGSSSSAVRAVASTSVIVTHCALGQLSTDIVRHACGNGNWQT